MMLHPYNVIARHYVYTVITSGLIHKDWMHLFLTCCRFISLLLAGGCCIGHWQFGVLYVQPYIKRPAIGCKT
jgi:membrane associated rhomboid family serine protease